MPKVFDINKVNVILVQSGNQYILDGFANNSTIEAEYKSDRYSIHVGAKGGNETAWAKNNDNSGTVKFKIMNTSDSNKVLNQLAKSGETFSLNVVDGNDFGKSEVTGTECVIQKPATWARGTEIQAQEWTIGVSNMDMNYD